MTKFTVQQFKEYFKSETGITLDFRKHVFLDNQFGATPCVNYDFAEQLITNLYAWGHQCIEDSPELFPTFGGWKYNLQMSCEKLRTEKIKHHIESVIDDLNNNAIKISEIFRGATIEIDVEAGFAWAEKDGQNLFQVCVDEDGQINRKESGFSWGVCGDFNTSRYGRDFDTLKLIHDEFIRFAENSGVETYDHR